MRKKSQFVKETKNDRDFCHIVITSKELMLPAAFPLEEWHAQHASDKWENLGCTTPPKKNQIKKEKKNQFNDRYQSNVNRAYIIP
jgi:hypothetical protein